MPALSMLRPLNVAVPPLDAAESVPESVPLPGGFVPIAMLTVTAGLATELPPRSSTRTVTAENVEVAVVVEGVLDGGSFVKTICESGPTEITKEPLVPAGTTGLDVAPSV